MKKTYCAYGTFRKYGVPYFGVLIIRILLVMVLYSVPLLSETPIEDSLACVPSFGLVPQDFLCWGHGFLH